MDFTNNLSISHHRLESTGFVHHIYNALSSMDLSAAVFGALRGMRIVGSLPYIPKTEKNAVQSGIFRKEGNEHFTSERYLMALECYNKALLFAPIGSMELMHAISNRSALLHKLKAYSASFCDIEICLKLGCTGELLKKLNIRKISCVQNMLNENFSTFCLISGFPEEFFKFNVKKHPEIPCLSADVGVVAVSGKRMIAAEKDIEIGTVVAVETAFTTYSDSDKSLVACYFCQKMTFNLIPCNNCCFALFCSIECQENCVSEYHDIECQIMSVLERICIGPKSRLTMKTVFKLLKKCKTWNKLIKESNNIGASRLNSSSVGQIFNSENYSSVLCFKEDHHFIHGFLYNCCFMYATVLHYLEKIPGFFPESRTDLEAKKCFAELCMRLGMSFHITTINTTANNFSVNKVQSDDAPSHTGWFSLTGKLRHSCDPNVLVIGLNNCVALVAVKHIKKMSEITISKIGHYYDRMYGDKRASTLYDHTLNVCSCCVCRDSWGTTSLKRDLSPQQKKIIQKWRKSKPMIGGYGVRDHLRFKDTCSVLSKLEDLVNTEEHIEIFDEFRTQLGLFQYAATFNVML